MNALAILIIGLVILVVLIAVGVYISSSSERNLMEDRLGRYLEGDQEKKQTEKKEESSSAFRNWVNNRVEGSSFGDRIAQNLARADLKFKSGEFVTFIVIFAGLLAFLGFVTTGTSFGARLLSGILGATFGVAIPIIYLRTQQGNRLKKFSGQLPDMLNLVVNGLRAGYSTMQALEAVSKEMPSPISDEFRRVVQEMQLGIPMDRALDNLLRRIPSEDLDFVITAINVQREVGGPLAEILDTISFTIRERIRIKGEIKVLTSQVVMSGNLISAVPFFVFVILWFINPKYMGEFFSPPIYCGVGALVTGVVMIIIGYFVMMKIADIEV